MITGLKDTRAARVGDTWHLYKRPVARLPGFKPSKSMVFAGAPQPLHRTASGRLPAARGYDTPCLSAEHVSPSAFYHDGAHYGSIVHVVLVTHLMQGLPAMFEQRFLHSEVGLRCRAQASTRPAAATSMRWRPQWTACA